VVTRTASAALALVAAAVVVASSQNPQPQQQPAPPTFRSPVVAVPVDVRVIDNKTGKPVTDLKQQDFTVLEDGARQDVRLFVVQRFDDTDERPSPATRPATGATTTADRALNSPTLTPQSNRVFLFVLGSGRLQEPSKGLDAAMDFVRTRLGPKDQVAAFAWNRATAFTSDHERVARVIERLREENDAVDQEVRADWSGLKGLYGSRDLPKSVRARLERIFADEGSATGSTTKPADKPAIPDRTKGRLEDAMDKALGGVMDAQKAADEAAGAAGPLPPIDWGPLDNFVAQNVQTMKDTANLYGTIAFMQRLDGEKHLVFVTERGLGLQHADDWRDLGRVAADSRVAVDVLQTGGLIGDDMTFHLRGLSEMTGGMASISEYSRLGLERLDAATRTSYLLGYYPTSGKWDGAFRTITVKVNRPGVTLVYRRGYNARVVPPVFDRVEYTTRFRVESAATLPEDVKDIGVTVSASLATEKDQTFADVSAQIDPAALHFEVRDGIIIGRITIAVVPMDSTRAIIGGKYKRQVANLQYDQETLALVRKIGIPYDVRLPVPAETRFIRVIVYDAAADRVGSAGVTVR
jgi:VWFA-related protein